MGTWWLCLCASQGGEDLTQISPSLNIFQTIFTPLPSPCSAIVRIKMSTTILLPKNLPTLKCSLQNLDQALEYKLEIQILYNFQIVSSSFFHLFYKTTIKKSLLKWVWNVVTIFFWMVSFSISRNAKCLMNRYISLNIIFNDSPENESLLFTNNIIM